MAKVWSPDPESRDSPWGDSGSPVTQANSFVKKKRDLIEVLSPAKSSKTEKDQEICNIEPVSAYHFLTPGLDCSQENKSHAVLVCVSPE